MIKHVIVDCDNVMQYDCVSLRDPKGPVSEWPQNFHDILDKALFILCYEVWLVFIGFWILEPLGGEFSELVASLKQLQSRIPTYHHIQNR